MKNKQIVVINETVMFNQLNLPLCVQHLPFSSIAETARQTNRDFPLSTGKSQFNNRLASLKGRKIIAFPDIDAYHDWLRRTADFPHLDLKVSDLLETPATPEARTAHIYLADWLIEFLEGKNNAK